MVLVNMQGAVNQTSLNGKTPAHLKVSFPASGTGRSTIRGLTASGGLVLLVQIIPAALSARTSAQAKLVLAAAAAIAATGLVFAVS